MTTSWVDREDMLNKISRCRNKKCTGWHDEKKEVSNICKGVRALERWSKDAREYRTNELGFHVCEVCIKLIRFCLMQILLPL